MTRRRTRARVALVVVTVLSLLGIAAPAGAAEYPSWSNVKTARSSEAGKQAQVTELTELITGLNAEVDAARAEASRRAATYEAAQNAFDDATLRATDLRYRADAAAAAASAAAALSRPAGGSSRPNAQGLSGWISSAYWARSYKPVAGVGAFHYGTDIAVGCGQNVSAASAGTVSYAGWLGSYGNWVLIDHGDDTPTGYAHNGSLLVSAGQQVSTGATIALVGTTGASDGCCHLHFETRVDGARINPQPFMSARGVTLG
ncbi:M23 family metallopeptidase [Cryobacterium sp. Y62]|uniref:M23 family metallopeptidase n=1 Tax=Cryobacterium sp. Y62 TaxID=2048284 RepID=UPI000CE3C30E|nr:M23 family metallopeptidase [Cryobacterium sp. Y62]